MRIEELVDQHYHQLSANDRELLGAIFREKASISTMNSTQAADFLHISRTTLTALIGATLEKKLRKVMPNALDLIMTPFVVMLVTFLVVILGIGPVMHIVELQLVAIVEFLVTIPFGIGGFIIGATYPLLVITGLHHTYTMIETSLLANTGFNPVITLCAMYGFANVGTCLAFFVKVKNEKLRQTSIGAMLSQLFGISGAGAVRYSAAVQPASPDYDASHLRNRRGSAVYPWNTVQFLWPGRAALLSDVCL